MRSAPFAAFFPDALTADRTALKQRRAADEMERFHDQRTRLDLMVKTSGPGLGTVRSSRAMTRGAVQTSVFTDGAFRGRRG